MQRYTKLLPKDDLKRFAKDAGKKLVAADYKNNRVEDPMTVSESHVKKIKKYVRDFYEKAVKKREVIDQRRKEKLANKATSKLENSSSSLTNGKHDVAPTPEQEPEDDVEFSDNESLPPIPDSPAAPATPITDSSTDNKRKRPKDEGESTPGGTEDSDPKRLKESPVGSADAPTPPPPPPPPASGAPEALDNAEGELLEDDHMDDTPLERPVHVETEEERELRQQEEDLMRENEEAELMDEDANGKGMLEEVNGNGVKDIEMGGTSKSGDLAVRQPEPDTVE